MGGSEDGWWEQGNAGTTGGEPDAGNNGDKVKRVIVKLKVTKMIDDKVKEMITRIQEAGDTMTIDQLQTVIMKSQEDGGDRRGERYKDEGGGT